MICDVANCTGTHDKNKWAEMCGRARRRANGKRAHRRSLARRTAAQAKLDRVLAELAETEALIVALEGGASVEGQGVA